ncbi:hypothetical protein Y1Q_0018519 [Alligator mississippiensis]|uniref:Uncharacterized protein n=1 Tax=Alligator mississippiensis TaxID=8496 RepID=A0A151P205_ALLMI|nr:hypothetical protein Y1Q_0018519 [Alligator mississippiensis]
MLTTCNDTATGSGLSGPNSLLWTGSGVDIQAALWSGPASCSDPWTLLQVVPPSPAGWTGQEQRGSSSSRDAQPSHADGARQS